MSAKEYHETVFGADTSPARQPHQRAFHYSHAWKPGGTRYEIERWAEWAGWYPKDKRRYTDHITQPSAPLTPQTLDGRIAFRLAENECKLLRSACRQIRTVVREASKGVHAGDGAIAYETVRFNLRIAEWAREYLMGKVSREALQERFRIREKRDGFPGVKADYVRKLLYLKIVQFAF